MLVLTRGVDESISIGDSIVVTVLSIEGDRVKIGIQAPREILISRGEIQQAVMDQMRIQKALAEEPNLAAFDELRQVLAEEMVDDNPDVSEDKTNKNPE